jgi:hypothetical protein
MNEIILMQKGWHIFLYYSTGDFLSTNYAVINLKRWTVGEQTAEEY